MLVTGSKLIWLSAVLEVNVWQISNKIALAVPWERKLSAERDIAPLAYFLYLLPIGWE